MASSVRQLITEKITHGEVFGQSAYSDTKRLQESYQAKCVEVFKDLESDREFPQNLDTQGFFKFSKYDMRDVEYNQAQAAQSALDFITGLKQYREEKKQVKVTHSEQELNEAFAYHEKMNIDSEYSLQELQPDVEEENLTNFKPKFISKAQRMNKDIKMTDGSKSLKHAPIVLQEESEECQEMIDIQMQGQILTSAKFGKRKKPTKLRGQ